MVEVAVSDPVSSREEEENLSESERYELDDFTLISSELAQEVGDGPAEKVDSEDTLPDLPSKKDKKKKKKKKTKPKKVSEPADVVPQDTSSPSEASVEEKPEKQKKSARKRLKRTRSDSEEEYDEEEIETPKKRKDRSAYDEDDEEEDKLERRKRKGDKKREELDNLASIRKAKEKSKANDKPREKVKDKEKSIKSKDKEKEKEKEKESEESGTSGSDSEPEDTEVVPVSSFLSEFRPSGALVVDEPPSTKRRSKFGESILSKRPSSPVIVPFERPRFKPTVPAPAKPQLSQLPTEPNGYQSNLHSQQHQPLPLPLGTQSLHQQQSQWDSYPQEMTDATGFPHHQWDKLMEQQQLELQQQQQLQLLQQQQMQQLHAQSLPHNGERSVSRTEEHNNHKHKKHAKDKEKRDKEKREKAKREKEKRDKAKREKAKREKKHKEKPPKLDPTTPEYATKRKEFKLKLSETIGLRLKKYFRAKRIATKEDFKHLARKFTHKIMDLEDAKAVFVIKSNTEEKIHKVIDAYFERHNTYSRAGNSSQPADQPDPAAVNV